MKIFLTGGTGFIGRPLTQRLLDRGWEVTALVRNPGSDESKEIQTLGAHLVQGDITNKESMRIPMSGVDVVIHNAAWYQFGISKKHRELMYKINVEGTRNTLNLAVELGIPKIIYTSTVLAFGRTGEIIADETYVRQYPPLTSYEETKSKAHEIAVELQRQGAPIIINCPASVFGPGDHSEIGYLTKMYVRKILPPILWTPNAKLAHIFVDDVAEGIVHCVEYGKFGETYILSTDNQTHKEMFDSWRGCEGGCKKTWIWLPDSIAIFINTIAPPFERLLGLPVVFSKEFIYAAKNNWQFSGDKAERELHIQFYDLENAWKDTIEGERELIKKK
ncbi:MAG: NAD-dependent epimerase/dehydratase family protein [Anaerolineaceae bacterium]|nr:NAD-dependent epimerase/dehydratase family protein [Anaerolineaceae bacterium]